MSRPVVREEKTVKIALFWTAIEPMFPVLASFFVNMAIVSIAANEVTGENVDTVGNTDFKNYLTRTGQIMWGIALLAAAQSSAITTTYTGQYIMDGFLQLRIALWKRAVLTRCVALIPCVVIAAVMDGNALNKTVNLVNALLGVLLPFALTPLVKFSTSKQFLGEHAPGIVETVILWFAAFAVYALNAFGLSAKGGGFFGDAEMNVTWLGILVQIVYFAWNAYIVWMPIKPMRDFTDPRPIEKSFGVVQVTT
jgi:natural resistance-associated macrophage protein